MIPEHGCSAAAFQEIIPKITPNNEIGWTMCAKKIIFENFASRINWSELLENSGRDLPFPAVKDDFRNMLGEIMQTANPCGGAIVGGIAGEEAKGEIRIEGTSIKNDFLYEKLHGLNRCFPYMVTEGKALAAWAAGLKEPEERSFMHLWRQKVVKTCESELEKKLCALFDISQLSSVNPGSLAEWPLNGQGTLFTLINPLPKKLGVNLLPSNIMQPDYTVSGIFFQTERKYYNCQLCPRNSCPNRKAPRVEWRVLTK